MTIPIAVFTNGPVAITVEGPGARPCGYGYRVDIHAEGHATLRRRTASVREPAYLANLGPRPVRVAYQANGKSVGPTTDFLAPMAIREIGLGPGVTWIVEEA